MKRKEREKREEWVRTLGGGDVAADGEEEFRVDEEPAVGGEGAGEADGGLEEGGDGEVRAAVVCG